VYTAPERISDTKNWLNLNGDLDNSNDSEDGWEAENESDTELHNNSQDSATTEQWNVSAAPNVPRFIWPIRRSKQNGEKALMMINILETRRNKGITKT
jgi:hypothetical protein